MSDAVEPPAAKSATLLSPAQYAAHLGVKRQSVDYAIAKGRLTAASCTFDPQRKRWKIDPEIADREWHANTRQRRGVGVTATQEHAELPASNDLVLPEGDGSLGIGLQDLPRDEDGKPLPPMMVAAIKTSLEARLKQLELEKTRGSLVPADAVTRTLEHIGRSLRDALLALPARLAHQLAGESDPVQVEIQLERALSEALMTLTRARERAA